MWVHASSSSRAAARPPPRRRRTTPKKTGTKKGNSDIVTRMTSDGANCYLRVSSPPPLPPAQVQASSDSGAGGASSEDEDDDSMTEAEEKEETQPQPPTCTPQPEDEGGERKPPPPPQWEFFHALDSHAGDIEHCPGLTVDQLKERCVRVGGAGFNTNGWIKSQVFGEGCVCTWPVQAQPHEGTWTLRRDHVLKNIYIFTHSNAHAHTHTLHASTHTHRREEKEHENKKKRWSLLRPIRKRGPRRRSNFQRRHRHLLMI